MKPLVRLFFILNIFVELLAPFIGLSLLFDLFLEPFEDAWAFLAAFLLVTFLLYTYALYAFAVVRVNKRRFPRVEQKAFFVFAAPLVIEALLYGFLGFPFETAIAFAGLHYYGATLISVLLESIQRVRVRAFSFPFSAWIAWLVGMAVTSYVLIAQSWVIWLSKFDADLLAWSLVWFAGLALIAFIKYHRPGMRLYAQKGYRPNAAVIVTDGEGHVLLCERADRPGTIQTVQGGIDPGETPEQAARRELTEELGLWPDEYELAAHLLETKRYDWSPDVRKKLAHTGYVGQQQYFFLAQTKRDVEFDLDYHHREFRKVWWGEPEQLLRLSWSQKRPGIQAALRGFGLLK